MANTTNPFTKVGRCGFCKKYFPTSKLREASLHKRLSGDNSRLYHNSMEEGYLCPVCLMYCHQAMRYHPHDYSPEFDTSFMMYPLGIELEYEMNSPDMYKQHVLYHVTKSLEETGCFGCFYAKHDGSMKYGMELVSSPKTLSMWKKMPLGVIMKEWGNFLHPESTCGMHVHIGKNSLTEETFYKLAALMYRYRIFFFLLGGRITKDGYISDYFLRNNRYFAFYRHSDFMSCRISHKYCAIALRENTVEFRIFASTLNPNTVLENVKICYHLTKMVKKYSLRQCTSSSVMMKYILKYFTDVGESAITSRLQRALYTSQEINEMFIAGERNVQYQMVEV